MEELVAIFFHYLWEIIPVLLLGFLISGFIQEFIPSDWVVRNLGGKGIKPIWYATVVGTFLPVCCFGSLPLAITFYRKGARLGPILAFLAATPATSVTALLITYRLLGLPWTIYLAVSVIIVGLVLGTLGNEIKLPRKMTEEITCPHCLKVNCPTAKHKITFFQRLLSVFKFAFWELPKDIGKETLLGIFLAAVVSTVAPIGIFIQNYLSGVGGYLFALIFGIIMYICATGSVPLVHALILKGFNVGSAMTLLILGPITALGSLLVIRKEFGIRVLLFYLIVISIFSLIFGYLFQILSLYP